MAKEHKPPTKRARATASRHARAKEPEPGTSSAVPADSAGTAATSAADPSTWRASRLWAGRRINRTRALKEYHLKKEDLAGLYSYKKEYVPARAAVGVPFPRIACLIL
ncbi:hypothetical protein GY45DRAFT_1325567 [Cubamyces sp. BRFM 1775]|nr:hypothetical protein GY45DRAFT_1325567 [Cubamyces sp. BRFM 1775]